MSEKSVLMTVMKIILIMSSIITGILLGSVIGFYGAYYLCLFIGSGFEQVGWAFLIFTVPFGMVVGGGLGFFLGFNFSPSILLKQIIANFFVLASAATIIFLFPKIVKFSMRFFIPF